jgi:predicted cation transporter
MGLGALGLFGVLVAVLLLPFSVRYVEEELEAFLLVMGVLAVSASRQWSAALCLEALREPLLIATAVLLAGLLFRRWRRRLRAWSGRAQERWGIRALSFMVVVGFGFLSCLITSIVAALALSEFVSALRLPRRAELQLVVLACYSIGLGSALTPLGGPLAAIAVSRLRGEPYHADFFFLARQLGPWIVPLVLAFGALAFLLVREGPELGPRLHVAEEGEAASASFGRALKAYVFVAGLVLLGQGFAPLADRFLASVPSLALYWINSLSAVLDNATLTAAELGPALSLERVRILLLGLLLAGGMLIPGNIPNIICAGKLGLGSKEWARVALPLGVGAMVLVFAVLLLS